jgi:hypothetical protein
MNIKYPNEWLHKNGNEMPYGFYLLEKYSNPINALYTLYPEYPWPLWTLENVPHNYWSEISNHKKFMDWMGAQLGITSHEQWYGVKESRIFFELQGNFILIILLL